MVGNGIRLSEHWMAQMAGSCLNILYAGPGGHRGQSPRQSLPVGTITRWIKIKNPAHPATERAMLIALSKRVQR